MNMVSQIAVIGIASSLDNLGVGVAYGVRRIAIPPLSNLVIAFIAFLFSCISIMAGSFLARFLTETTANAIGACAIIGMGIWVIYGAGAVPKPRTKPSRLLLMEVLDAPEAADRDRSGVISLSEALILGVALSLNCLTNCIPIGLWRLSILPAAVVNAVLSYAGLWGGVWLGRRWGAHWLGGKANAFAGVLLVLLGLHQLFHG